METDINDFIVALISTGAVLHKEGEILKATGLILRKDDLGDIVNRGESMIRPKYYGFDAVQVGEEIHFSRIKTTEE